MKSVSKLLTLLLLVTTFMCLLPSCEVFSSLFVPEHNCEQYLVWEIEDYPTEDEEGSKNLICHYCQKKLIDAPVRVVSKGLSYEINNGGVYITGIGACPDAEIIIPKRIDGKNVVGIKEFAFENNETIKSVIMPPSIKEIGDGAFRNISTLEDVILSENLKKMGDRVFSNTGLKSVYIPGSLKDYLGTSAFSGCEKLQMAILGEGIEHIGYNTFAYCFALEFVSLPSSLRNIQNAFYGCENLAVVNFRGDMRQYCELERTYNSLRVEDRYPTFYNAKILLDGNEFPKDIKIPAGTTKIADFAFSFMDITSVNIPDSVTHIGYQAFLNCESLETVKFGNGLKTIDSYAFVGCESLKEIKIKDGIESIGHGAFQGCRAVEYVEIGEGIEILNAYTFEALISLREIKLPSTLKSYKEPLFLFDTKLEKVYYGGTVEQWLEFINSAYPYTCDDYDKVRIYCSDGEVYDNKRVEK